MSTREYLRLTDYLGPDQPVTGFLCHSLNETKAMNVSVQDVVAEYVDHIRRDRAARPVLCWVGPGGGLLAWEAARQLAGDVDIRLIAQVDVCDLGQDFARCCATLCLRRARAVAVRVGHLAVALARCERNGIG